MQTDFASERKFMVERHLRVRGITDEHVLKALGAIPRERFVPEGDADRAYGDHPIPIGHGQTISQPYMVALMTQCLGTSSKEKVLEIGTGSGYQTAVLCELAGEVYTIERVPELSQRASKTLRELGYRNFQERVGDGTLGWPEKGPFDAIMVTASAPEVPESLKRQLAEGGRLVIPVGPQGMQVLMVLTRQGGRTEEEAVCDCVFVRLIGKEGWREDD